MLIAGKSLSPPAARPASKRPRITALAGEHVLTVKGSHRACSLFALSGMELLVTPRARKDLPALPAKDRSSLITRLKDYAAGGTGAGRVGPTPTPLTQNFPDIGELTTLKKMPERQTNVLNRRNSR
jgi:hypothetical protein